MENQDLQIGDIVLLTQKARYSLHAHLVGKRLGPWKIVGPSSVPGCFRLRYLPDGFEYDVNVYWLEKDEFSTAVSEATNAE